MALWAQSMKTSDPTETENSQLHLYIFRACLGANVCRVECSNRIGARVLIGEADGGTEANLVACVAFLRSIAFGNVRA